MAEKKDFTEQKAKMSDIYPKKINHSRMMPDERRPCPAEGIGKLTSIAVESKANHLTFCHKPCPSCAGKVGPKYGNHDNEAWQASLLD